MDESPVERLEDSKSEIEESAESVKDSAEDVEDFFELFYSTDSPVKEWIILTGNRRKVIGTLMLAVAGMFLLAGLLNPIEVAAEQAGVQTVKTLFNTLLSGVILLISIVVSVNSIVVSQQLSSIGSSEQRVEQAMEFRKEADKHVSDGTVVPSNPAKFLKALVDEVNNKSQRLLDDDAADGDIRDEDILEDQKQFVERVQKTTEKVEEQLDSASFEPFDVFSAGLSYNHTKHLDTTYQLNRQYRDSLSDSQQETFEELMEIIQLVAAALEYFKTLYFQEEFANLSRDLIYSGLPTVMIISYVVLWFGTDSFHGLTLVGVSGKYIAFAAIFTVALVPFIVLTAYILRAAAVAKRTLAAGPFRFD